MLVHSWNWCFHWSTDTLLVHRHRQLFLMRDAAATPTSDLPAPQGSTMMPDLTMMPEEEEQRSACGRGRVGVGVSAWVRVRTGVCVGMCAWAWAACGSKGVGAVCGGVCCRLGRRRQGKAGGAVWRGMESTTAHPPRPAPPRPAAPHLALPLPNILDRLFSCEVGGGFGSGCVRVCVRARVCVHACAHVRARACVCVCGWGGAGRGVGGVNLSVGGAGAAQWACSK